MIIFHLQLLPRSFPKEAFGGRAFTLAPVVFFSTKGHEAKRNSSRGKAKEMKKTYQMSAKTHGTN